MGSTDPRETEDDWVDVLRATLAGHEVEGRVLTKRITGDVGVFLVEAAGRTWVGDAVVDAEGFFRIEAASLRKAAWRLNRLVIAVADAAGNRAEGFVLAEDFREVADRVGPLADRFMALLAGTETPSDVAAIMSWFCANPAHLRTVPAGGGASEPDKYAPFRPVSVAELLALPPEPPIGAGLVPTASGVKGWSGFMRQLVAAFRSPGVPSPPGSDRDDDDDGDSDGAGQAAPDKAIPRAFEVFEKLLHVLLSGPPEHRQPMLCFELAHYLCSKLDPDASKARGWLRRIVASMSNADVLEDRREDVGAAIGVLYADGDPAAMRGARKLFFDLGIEVSGKPPSSKGIAGFVGALDAKPDLTSFWEAVQKARTLDEQRASYLAAFAGGRPSDGYPDLAGLVAEWPALERAIVDAKARKRVILTTSEACPKHWMTLPLGELSNLRLYGFGVARNCSTTFSSARPYPHEK